MPLGTGHKNPTNAFPHRGLLFQLGYNQKRGQKKGKHKAYCTEKGRQGRRVMKCSYSIFDQNFFVFPNYSHGFIAEVPPQFCSLLGHSRAHKSSYSRLHTDLACMGKCSRGSASVVLRVRNFRLPMFCFAFSDLSVSCSTCSAFLLALTSAGTGKCLEETKTVQSL